MRLDGFGLFVEDMAKMIRFYRDVLGFEIKESEDTSNVYLVKDGTLFLLYGRKDFENMTHRRYEYIKGLNGHSEIALYKNRNMTEKADELIRQMDNLWRFPPTLPPADSELEAERRNRFTVEFCSYKENIEGEDSVTSANEWRLIGLMNLVGYGATGLFPNLVKEKETVDCLIEEYMLNLKKVK